MSNFMSASLTVNDIYPVGSIYMSVNGTDPARLFGGAWERIKERFLLGAGDTHTAGSTGGEFEHKLTINEMPSHKHEAVSTDGNSRNVSLYPFQMLTSKSNKADTNVILPTGGDRPHNTTPPIWQCIFGVAPRKIGESGVAV